MNLLIKLFNSITLFKDNHSVLYYLAFTPLLVLTCIDYNMSFGHTFIYALCLILFCIFELLLFIGINSLYEISISVKPETKVSFRVVVFLLVFLSITFLNIKYSTTFSHQICKIMNCVNHIEKPVYDYNEDNIDGVPARFQ